MIRFNSYKDYEKKLAIWELKVIKLDDTEILCKIIRRR